jgi:hypothetical protein
MQYWVAWPMKVKGCLSLCFLLWSRTVFFLCHYLLHNTYCWVG